MGLIAACSSFFEFVGGIFTAMPVAVRLMVISSFSVALIIGVLNLLRE